MTVSIKLVDELDSFQGQIDRFFGGKRFLSRKNHPLTDFYENKDEFKIVMNVPGINKENINIDSDSECMEISINQEEIKEDSNDKFYIKERRTGKTSRTISFPSHVDPSKSSLSLKDGILTIAVPKAETAKKISLTVD